MNNEQAELLKQKKLPPRYKAGDKVKCVNNVDYKNIIKLGEEFEVIEVYTTTGATTWYANIRNPKLHIELLAARFDLLAPLTEGEQEERELQTMGVRYGYT